MPKKTLRKQRSKPSSHRREAGSPAPAEPRKWKKWLLACLLIPPAIVALIVAAFDDATAPSTNSPRLIQRGRVVDWWEPVPPEIRAVNVGLDSSSNIAPGDYAGPDSCASCHPKQYGLWSEHPHRWMNAVADHNTVKGDFEGSRSVEYLGGRATFFRQDEQYRMRLQRDQIQRVYAVSQTIGSRFYQYYVGHLLEGPEPPEHSAYSVDHVLPFGYWLDRKEWVPTVHVHWAELDGERVDEEDLPSSKRHDPFAAPHEGFSQTNYYNCNQCHTTMPLGDLLVRNPDVIGRHAPAALHFSVLDYLLANHSELPLPADAATSGISDGIFQQVLQQAVTWDAREHAVTLGVSCESCHLGARAHAEGKLKRPRFFPHSPDLFVYSENHQGAFDHGRNQTNVNWACGRCHAGGRRSFAGGMATWNSTEYTDAMLGSCYSQLKCADCHDPHRATGKRWKQTAAEDNANCLRCHEQFKAPEALEQHTHHAPTSAGSNCLDCHMPRLNEGLQDVVRTHTIFSPTNQDMLAANHPNACNLCHVEKPIDWTLGHLNDWYGTSIPESALKQHYPTRQGPAATGWLKSPDQSVRLVALDALTRQKSHWALPEMLEALDDPFLVNRQFARINLEQLLGVTLADHGYQFYMTRQERAEPLVRLRHALLAPGSSSAEPPESPSAEGPGSENAR